MGQGSARYNSITTYEKQLVMESWIHIRQNLSDFGLNLFTVLINAYPHIANYWPISSDFIMEHFAGKFVSELDRFVMHIHMPTTMKSMLQANAIKHAPRHIDVADYRRLRRVIIAAIGERIVTARRNETLHAWGKVITICFGFLTEMAEDHLDEQTKQPATAVNM